MSERRLVGVDLGGTNIKAVATDECGAIRASVLVKTDRQDAQSAVLDRAFTAARSAAEQAGWSTPTAIGVGVCGLADTARGTLVASPILPEWRDVPIAGILQQRCGCPVSVNNDANAAIFAEYRLGAGAGHRTVVGLTLGTGIGGGAIIGGKLFRGSSGFAAEFGHIPVTGNGPVCFCGGKGCLGRMASATAVSEECRRLLAAGQRSSLQSIFASRGAEAIDTVAIGQAAATGDELALQLIQRAAQHISVALTVLANCFNPDLVILSGGMSAMGDALLKPIQQMVSTRTFPAIARSSTIVRGQLGLNAGALGAALLCLEDEGGQA